MFTPVSSLSYERKSGRELIWKAEVDATAAHVLAGTFLGDGVVRVRALRNVVPEMGRYQLIDDRKGTLPYHSWSVIKGDEDWPDEIGEDQVRAILEPYLQGFAFSTEAIRLTRPLASKERIFGLGERTGEMDKRGQTFPIWNVDPPMHHRTETVTMYTSIPFYLGFTMNNGQATGTLIDATSLIEMDIGHTNETEMQIVVPGDTLNVYFFAGPTTADVMRQFTELTGRMPLPPRWSLGYHQCRWGYTSEEQVLQIASRLRERNHPCDVIWLDIDYMNGYRNFTWNPETFPQPGKMTDALHDQGLHLVTIIDPGTKVDENYSVYKQGMEQDYFCRYEDGRIFTGSVWPGKCVFPDFSQSKVRTWWGNLYKELLDEGVDGIWNDMDEPALTNFLSENTEPTIHGATMSSEVLHRAGGETPTGPDGPPVLHKFFHNAFGMEMARSSYEGLRRLRPDQRPFVLTRSGTTGMQRYAALWTGDNTSEWEHLLMAMPMCLNIGMSGVPFVGVDICGFWDATDGELLVRFAQLGALLPFCRNHNALHQPDKEPWAFGEPFESAHRKAIELRYRLLPYLYNLFHQAATSGAPIMRPLYYHYPDDEQACDVQDAFLLGDALLSAPIYESGATSRKVYLPNGPWFDYWDGKEYPGADWSDIPAPLDRWPLLVANNSIIPSGPPMEFTDQTPTDPLTFTCYMADDGLASYSLYEDDGTSFAYEKGTFAQTFISCRVDSNLVTVEIEEQFKGFIPQREEYVIIVYAAGRTLKQHVKAGQGKVNVRF